MAEANTPDAGTTETPEVRDGAVQDPAQTGTPEGAAGSEAAKGLENVDPKLVAEWKTAAEERNALRARVQELEGKQAAQPTPPTAGQSAELEQLRSKAEDGRRQLYEAARGGDPVALHLVQSEQRMEFLTAQNKLLSMPEAKRGEVLDVMQKHGIRDPDEAAAYLRLGQTDSLAEEVTRLKAELARMQKAPVAPNTHTASAAPAVAQAAGGAAEHITFEEYQARAVKDPMGTRRAHLAGKIKLPGEK